MEPGDGLRPDFPRLRALLRQDASRSGWRGNPGPPVRARGSTLRSGRERLEQPLKWKRPARDLRELDERPLPRGRCRVDYIAAGLRRRWSAREPTHVSDPDKATGSDRRARTEASVASTTCGWASASRTSVSSHRADQLRTGPRGCAFHLELSRYWAPLADLDLAEIDWLIAGGESGHRAPTRPMRNGSRELRDRLPLPSVSPSSSSNGEDGFRKPAAVLLEGRTVGRHADRGNALSTEPASCLGLLEQSQAGRSWSVYWTAIPLASQR